MPASSRPKKKSVAVTGANGYVGRLALARLLESSRVGRVLALDREEPELSHPKLSFAPLDLTRADAVESMTAALADAHVDTLVHLAFFASPVRDAGYAHEVEAVGTGHVLAAAAAAHVGSLVMSSTTFVYGASPQNPNFLTEDRALPARAVSRTVADRVEAEQQVRAWRATNPSMRSTVLRFASIVGPTVDTPVTRYLGRAVAPVVLGYDPLVQCVHEDDVGEAILCAVLADKCGDFNICGRGVVPLSTALSLTGAKPLPLPLSVAAASLRALNAVGVTAVPTRMLDYLRFLWIADGTRAERELGFRPRYSTREALLSFARSRSGAAAA
jgi:UDP-glucose 4-epimerase